MSQPIVLYDTPSNVPGKAWSPNMTKTRFCLGYKGITFRTVWLESPDIKAHMKSIGAKPTGKELDGSDIYTIPTIHDPSTGQVVSDSFAIAEYLEKTYPSPALFPANSNVLIKLFESSFLEVLSPCIGLLFTKMPKITHPRTGEYLRTVVVPRRGVKWEDLSPSGKYEENWQKTKVAFGKINEWYSSSGGKWIMGDTVSYADMIFAAMLRCYSLVLDTNEWAEMATWHEGRWTAILKETEEFLVLT